MAKRAITNGKAQASLMLGVLSFFLPFIGIILAAVGMIFSKQGTQEIRRSRERGEGLAKAGSITSIAGLCVQLFYVIGFTVFYA
ncbi:DUF4190 domain-containing protein [Salsuginibacillus kocurii]|uniref:DUF4190 domain-containing protein n=1 Tax=Salsuginibacillus kocurii TaxID=427078 RepID=UPI000380BA4B|nr:DUF4190 domain-containing protein [Salsuginibacillus kocurii]